MVIILILPASSLKEYPSIAICEEKVLEHYKLLAGQTRGAAIVNYLSIAESLPTYGHHYYEVKDKAGTVFCLGLSYRGISQYSKDDRRNPKKVFLWKQLENLYYRDRKFTIEVHEARRVVHTLSSFNLYEDAIEEPAEEFDDLSNAICDPTTQVSVSRRTLAPANVTVYVWYASSPLLAKCIWSMAIAQHQFYLDRNNKKSRTCIVRSLSQIASELCRSVQSLSSASSLSNISRSNSSTSLPTIIVEGEISEESKAATIEMLTALHSRKEALQEALKKKTEELKKLCIKEGELTGELPPETPFSPGEVQPQVRRRIGTSFTLSDKIICRAKSKDRQTLNDLELDYEIQSKIASAAFKLANDVTARKSVRKIRKVSYQQAASKLKDIEQKLCTLKREKEAQKKEREIVNQSSSDDKAIKLTGLPNSSSENSISEKNLNSPLNNNSVLPSSSLPHLIESTCVSAPPSPAKCRQRHQSLQHVPIITTDVYEDVNLPFESHDRRNSSSYSLASEHDSLSCGSSSIASLGITYRNRFEANLNIEGTNHYSVPNRRASQAFNDCDDLTLDERTNDLVSTGCDDNSSEGYSHPLPLSSSFDERLTYDKSDGCTLIVKNHSYNNHNFDNHSLTDNLRYNDSNNHLTIQEHLPRSHKKFNHSHSENSLHSKINSYCHKLDTVHISDPDLKLDHIENQPCLPHVYSMPALRNGHRAQIPEAQFQVTSSTLNHSSSFTNNHNQVNDFIQPPTYFQENKKSFSSSSMEYCSPRPKAKEWIETSLDSPIQIRKRKPKQPETYSGYQQFQWQENGLPSNDQVDSFYTHKTNMGHYDKCNNISLQRKSPSVTSLNYNSNDYSNVPHPNPPSQLLNDRAFNNNAPYPLISDNDNFHHYQNTTDIFNSISNSSHSSPCGNIYSTNVVYNSHLDFSTKQSNEIIDNSEEKIVLSVAEPQQPSKHATIRNINREDDNYNIASNLTDVHDYENINFAHEYHMEPSLNFLDIPSYNHDECKLPAMIYENSVHTEHYLSDSSLKYIENKNEVHSPQNEQFYPTEAEKNCSQLSPLPQNISFSPTVEVNVVSVGHFQPYWEETKPYELSDFYKYSTKHRKQQKSSQHTNETHLHHDIPENSEKNSHVYSDPIKRTREIQQRDCSYSGEIDHCDYVAQIPFQDAIPYRNMNSPLECNEGHQIQNEYYDGGTLLAPNLEHPEDSDKNISFGEPDRISLADTFHDEMVAWYQNQDAVKKATLV